MKPHTVLTLLVLCLFNLTVLAQTSDSTKVEKLLATPDKMFSLLSKKSRQAEEKLQGATDKYLSELSKQEQKLYKKIFKKDSLLAEQLFEDVEGRYETLKHLSSKSSKYKNVYSGHLDSLTTALKFLKDDKFSKLHANPELQKSLSQLSGLQDKLNQTDQVKKYLDQRQHILKEHLQRLGMGKELKKFKKHVYYYQDQVKVYKEIFEHPDKLEQKLLGVIKTLPPFKNFFARHSQLSGLFSMSAGDRPGNDAAALSMQGLQTRKMLEQTLKERFGSSTQVSQLLQQNAQGASGIQALGLQSLQDKLNGVNNGSFGNGGNETMPDFKPNQQRTKSFLTRLEYGGNIQSQKARGIFPSTSDLGLSLGYKLNDKSVIGVGAAYKMGMGSGWNKIKITHEGVGLRSFVDYKIKGNFYINGGYEQNYKNRIKSFEQLKNYGSWQSSGLVGVSKKYQVSKKMKGSMQILWDFLSYRQVPKAQPVVFRIGYSMK